MDRPRRPRAPSPYAAPGPRAGSNATVRKTNMDKRLAECQRVIGYHFANPNLLEIALTHSSLRTPDRECNERLEFLGDSVLGLVITEELYRLLPDQAEGELTRIKSAVVSRGALYRASTTLGLARFAEFARGVGRRNELPVSVIANLVESVIGAIYLDAGYFPAREFVLRHLGRGARRHAERPGREELQEPPAARGAAERRRDARLPHDRRGGSAPPQAVHGRGRDRRAGVGARLRRDQEGGRAGGRPQGARGLAAARPRSAPPRRAQDRGRAIGASAAAPDPRRAGRRARRSPRAPRAAKGRRSSGPERAERPATLRVRRTRTGRRSRGRGRGRGRGRACGRGVRGGADARGRVAAEPASAGRAVSRAQATASRAGEPAPRDASCAAAEAREPSVAAARGPRRPRARAGRAERPPARPPVDDFAAGLDETLPSRETAARAAADRREPVEGATRATPPDRGRRCGRRPGGPDRGAAKTGRPTTRRRPREPSRRRRRRAGAAAGPAGAERAEEPGRGFADAAPETAPRPRRGPRTRASRSAEPAPQAAAPWPPHRRRGVPRRAPAPATRIQAAPRSSRTAEPAAKPRRAQPREAARRQGAARAQGVSPLPLSDGFGDGHPPVDETPKAPTKKAARKKKQAAAKPTRKREGQEEAPKRKAPAQPPAEDGFDAGSASLVARTPSSAGGCPVPHHGPQVRVPRRSARNRRRALEALLGRERYVRVGGLHGGAAGFVLASARPSRRAASSSWWPTRAPWTPSASTSTPSCRPRACRSRPGRATRTRRDRPIRTCCPHAWPSSTGAAALRREAGTRRSSSSHRIAALIQPVPSPEVLDAATLVLRPGEEHPLASLLEHLALSGYARVGAVEAQGEFAARGGVVDLWPWGAADARAPRLLRGRGRVDPGARRGDAAQRRRPRRASASSPSRPSGSATRTPRMERSCRTTCPARHDRRPDRAPVPRGGGRAPRGRGRRAAPPRRGARHAARPGG